MQQPYCHDSFPSAYVLNPYEPQLPDKVALATFDHKPDTNGADTLISLYVHFGHFRTLHSMVALLSRLCDVNNR